MAACDTQALLDENPCLAALLPFNLEVLKAQILCNIKNYLEDGTEMTCDIQELLDDASCFAALTPFQLSVVQTQLLCDVSGLLGAESGTCTPILHRQYGTFADPNGNVTGCIGDLYVDTTTGTVWPKRSGDNTNTGWG